jgi:hypothetical protein
MTNQQQLLSILNTEVRVKGLVAVAHREIAAKLNIASGADDKLFRTNIGKISLP